MSTIKQEVRNLADLVKAELKLGANGVVEVSEGAFERTLEPAGLTLAEVTKVQNHTTDLVAATGLALGELGLDAFKADKELAQVSVSLPTGKDAINFTFQRQKEVAAGTGKDAGTQIKYGYLTGKIDVNAHANKGSLRRVKDHLNEVAKKMLEA